MPTFYARFELVSDHEDSRGVVISAAEAAGMAGALLCDVTSITYPPVLPPNASTFATVVWEPLASMLDEEPPRAFRGPGPYYPPREGVVVLATPGAWGSAAAPTAVILQYESAAAVALSPAGRYDPTFPPQATFASFQSHLDEEDQLIEARFDAVGGYVHLNSFRFWAAAGGVVAPTAFWTRRTGTSETL